MFATDYALELLRPVQHAAPQLVEHSEKKRPPEDWLSDAPSDQLRIACDWFAWDVIGRRFEFELFAAASPRLATTLHEVEHSLSEGEFVYSVVPQSKNLDKATKTLAQWAFGVLRRFDHLLTLEVVVAALQSHLEGLATKFDPIRICLHLPHHHSLHSEYN